MPTSGKREKQRNSSSYSTRKKGLGPFKAQLWGLPENVRAAIREDLEKKFGFYFDQLQVTDTSELVRKYVPPVGVEKKAADFGLDQRKSEDVSDLAD